MISHHRLEGKFVNLVRPLAVLEKKVRPDRQDRDAGTGILVDVVNGKRRNLEDAEPVGMVKRAKQADGEEDAIARSSSPPPGPKARDALDFSSSPPRQTPIKPRTVSWSSKMESPHRMFREARRGRMVRRRTKKSPRQPYTMMW